MYVYFSTLTPALRYIYIEPYEKFMSRIEKLLRLFDL